MAEWFSNICHCGGKVMAKNGTRGKSGFVTLLVLVFCLAAAVFIGTEVFQVKKITVIGSDTLDNNVIINVSGISYEENIFKISKEQVKNRIESFAPYPVVKAVSMKLPDEVIIVLEERVPAAAVPYLSSYLIIDCNGFILDIVKQSQGVSLPVLEGIHVSCLSKGSFLEVSEKDSYQFKVLTHFLKSLEEWEIKDRIKAIYIDNPDDITLLTNDDIKVSIGQALDLDRKLGWLCSEAYTQVLEKGEPGTLDVRTPGKAVFHPTPVPEDEADLDGETDPEAASNQEVSD
jgi:cell division protein FtsQ